MQSLRLCGTPTRTKYRGKARQYLINNARERVGTEEPRKPMNNEHLRSTHATLQRFLLFIQQKSKNNLKNDAFIAEINADTTKTLRLCGSTCFLSKSRFPWKLILSHVRIDL